MSHKNALIHIYVQNLIRYMCRYNGMDDVYDEFLRYLDAPTPALDGPAPASLHTEHGDPDESLLDADDDEEEV
jgi:hypothetical protein